jgi:hypothetical protein
VRLNKYEDGRGSSEDELQRRRVSVVVGEKWLFVVLGGEDRKGRKRVLVGGGLCL